MFWEINIPCIQTDKKNQLKILNLFKVMLLNYDNFATN